MVSDTDHFKYEAPDGKMRVTDVLDSERVYERNRILYYYENNRPISPLGIIIYTMKKLIALFSLLPLQTLAGVTVTDLRVERLMEPLGLETECPRFSWQIVSDESDVKQQSYRVLVSSTPDGKGDLWDSGTVASDEQMWIPYSGKELKPRQRAYWTVTVTTDKGTSTSEPQQFGMGMMGESHWSGRWIGSESMDGGQRGRHTRLPARYLRKEFQLKGKPVKRATAYISGLGLYRFFVGGREVGALEMLKPAPTDYRKTVPYNTYDVTDCITDSVLPIGIILGNGRYYPMQQHKPSKTPVFGLPTCRMNLFVEYADGSRQTLSTDESWSVSVGGPIRSNNEYDGEVFDANLDFEGWKYAGFDDSDWARAERSALPYGTLRSQPIPSMSAEKVGAPRDIHQYGDTLILDFGENMAGYVEFVPRGARGDTVKVKYAERLTPDGRLYTANLRDAETEDTYICSGRENGSAWAPSFVYHGFRYAQVVGKADGFTAVKVGDPMETGYFECADTILNRVIANALRGIKANYKGMPVDCPQRNERQPWLGDRTAGSLGESQFVDCERLYTKWVRDICDAQREDGCIPDVAPAFWNYYTDNVTWPMALPMACDMLLTQYGNRQPMVEAYPHIVKWLRHIIKEYQRDGIITRDRYGDWCLPPEKPEMIHSEDPARKTDGPLISTAYIIKCLSLLESFAREQGIENEAIEWAELRKGFTDSFNRKFLTCKPGTSPAPGHPLYPDSIFYGNNTATANVLALAFDIVPDSLRKSVTDNLVTNILTTNNGHVPCGVIGISWLMQTLSREGRGDVAWLLATNKTFPSWGYMAENGATTIWELWNGDTAAPQMNSGNHVMLLGDLLTWAQQDLGGIHASDKPGHFEMRADFSIPDCEWVNAARPTPYGLVKSHWHKDLMNLEWTITLPANTSATVHLPDGTKREIGSGTHTLRSEIPTGDERILADEHLYTRTRFPQCHASTIVETRDGDLVAAYFGGTHERHPDVCIWVSRKPKGTDKWSDPILAGDGVYALGTPDAALAGINDSTTLASVGPVLPYHSGLLRRKACWNPVLTEMPDGELWLFYKVGLRVADWTGWVVKSRDGGLTWSERQPLPEGFLGPVKNKPILLGDRLICPSSTESGGWKLHFEILDIPTGNWRYIGPIPADPAYHTEDLLADGTPAPGAKLRPIDCIQPSILTHSDGRLQVMMRTRNGRVATSWSADGGETWSNVTLTDVPNNQSGTDAVTLHDGRHILIYNDFSSLPTTKKGPRTPLSIAESRDGVHWRHILTLEDSPISQYSYPAIIEASDGTLHCVYTWRRQRVAYKHIDLSR